MSNGANPNNDKHKWVYAFGAGSAEGSAAMKSLLGGKGANLAEMSNIGLPVPSGFTITTEVCKIYHDAGKKLPEALEQDVLAALEQVGAHTSKKFGDPQNPLLVSVRSGARASMPGMMNTVLDVGLNDETVEGLALQSSDKRFAYDSYRRFIQMFADVVMGVDHHSFEDILETYKNLNAIESDTEMSADDWSDVIEDYKECVQKEAGRPFPQNVHEQIMDAISAVFGSWNTPRARTYRVLHNIPETWGTAVNVQAMVFGNMGENSATGVAFTRDPSSGEKTLFGEFLINAQGEDVVAGIRTPNSLTIKAKEEAGNNGPALEEVMPEAFNELSDVCDRLESHYQDMQDIEFTIQEGKLWMLQTRDGKRAIGAALKIAVDMVKEGLLTKEQAVMRVDPMALDQLLHPTLDPKAPRKIIAKGLPASPGAASGIISFDPDETEKLARKGEKVVLVRQETSPEDVHGMFASSAIVTARGGMTSHAAVVARGMGRPCVSGAGALHIDYANETVRAGVVTLSKGDTITIDGSTGDIMSGKVAMRQASLSGEFATLMGWADEFRRLEVRANAETPRDARQARDFGAEGIGLCRTEHMFFEISRVTTIREMILADTAAESAAVLARILPMQRNDFAELFEIMGGQPVTIRLLDPPLHEFLPHDEEGIKEVATAIGIDKEKLRQRVEELREVNPMMGHRGCRLAISHPEICEMQVRAILEAAQEAAEKTNAPVLPEIMVPLVSGTNEYEYVKSIIERVAKEVSGQTGKDIPYLIGTMIELPRACFVAHRLAKEADFFSFGTNDLTQMAFGLSRDDVAPITEAYKSAGLLQIDPFTTLDVDGVGALVQIGAQKGRETKPNLKLGICGEHGGDPRSIEFCEQIGLDYVSCSPFRVPVARLAAAQSALKASQPTGTQDT